MNTIYTEQQRIDYAREYREWKAAGKSMKAYAINKGILPRTLQNWVKKYHKESLARSEESNNTSLVKIKASGKLLAMQPNHTSSLKVTMGSIQVELPEGNNDADLKRVFKILKEMI